MADAHGLSETVRRRPTVSKNAWPTSFIILTIYSPLPPSSAVAAWCIKYTFSTEMFLFVTCRCNQSNCVSRCRIFPTPLRAATPFAGVASIAKRGASSRPRSRASAVNPWSALADRTPAYHSLQAELSAIGICVMLNILIMRPPCTLICFCNSSSDRHPYKCRSISSWWSAVFSSSLLLFGCPAGCDLEEGMLFHESRRVAPVNLHPSSFCLGPVFWIFGLRGRGPIRVTACCLKPELLGWGPWSRTWRATW